MEKLNSIGRDFRLSIADLEGDFKPLSIRSEAVEQAISQHRAKVEELCRMALQMEHGTKVIVSPLRGPDAGHEARGLGTKMKIEWDYCFVAPDENHVPHNWAVYRPWDGVA